MWYQRICLKDTEHFSRRQLNATGSSVDFRTECDPAHESTSSENEAYHIGCDLPVAWSLISSEAISFFSILTLPADTTLSTPSNRPSSFTFPFHSSLVILSDRQFTAQFYKYGFVFPHNISKFGDFDFCLGFRFQRILRDSRLHTSPCICQHIDSRLQVCVCVTRVWQAYIYE